MIKNRWIKLQNLNEEFQTQIPPETEEEYYSPPRLQQASEASLPLQINR